MGGGGSKLREVEDFEVGRGWGEGEADEGGFLVEALAAGGAGIDMQEFVVLVVHDAEDVAVAADKDVGL